MSKILRRDFINGTLMVAGASMFPFGGKGDSVLASFQPSYYPPALTGLRGSQPGSNTHAHARAFDGKSDWGPTTNLKEEYDLVVVGGGISGLSAAYFYQQVHGRDKRVLILDNHDDFGGHARRNEHTVGGDTRIVRGGSESLENPHGYSDVAKGLLDDLGVNPDRFNTAYDFDFFRRHDLGAVTYFNKKTFGEDKVVKHPYCRYPSFIAGLKLRELAHEEAVQQAPLSERGKEQLLTVLKGGLHVLPVSQEESQEYMSTHSYFDYLQTTLGVDDPGVLRMARHSVVDVDGAGADVMTIAEALDSGAMGLDPSSLEDVMDEEEYRNYIESEGYLYDEGTPYIHHFPDGNASIARLLVRKMIPGVGPGNNADDIVLSRFQYDELDRASNAVRLRLNSTVVNAVHRGDPDSSSEVTVTYINDNKSYQVTGRAVVMACYNMMIPYLVPDLPVDQAAALKRLVKLPIQITTVGLRNWRAMKEMGIGMAMSPGNMHQVVGMDYPISMGGYEFTSTPDDPCAIYMTHVPVGETVGAPPVEQFREARHRMLALEFDDYETEAREHLSGMLPKNLFEFDRDVESISVNRWAHGYAHNGYALYDPEMPEMARMGRQPFGRITIANIDSAPSSYVNVAIDQAWRAVGELG
jgi:spermidine dehydrogenase